MAAIFPDPIASLWPPFLLPAAASLLGAWLGWLVPDWRFSIPPLLLAGIAAAWFWQRRRHLPIAVLLAVGCLLFAFSHLCLLVQCGREAQQRLAGGIRRETGAVAWVITPAEQASDDGWGRVAVRLSSGALVQLSGAVGTLLPGQQIAFQARFALPAGQRNPGGFDERLYLARDAIFLKADLFLGRLTVTDARSDMIGVSILKLRASLRRAASAILPREQAALLLGILMGDTSQMDPDERAAFQAAGLSHLTAVSGANVSFLLAPVAFLLARLLRRRKSRIIGLTLFLVGFGFLTGWEASVTRAIVMTGMALAGKLVMRRSDPLNALLFAATIMLLARPLLVVSLSFHLSFLATAGILLGQARLLEWLQRWLPFLPSALRAILALNLSVQLTVLPLQILATGSFSPLSLLANLPALPLAEGVTLLGAGVLLIAMLLLPWLQAWAWLRLVMQAAAWPVGFLLQALSRLAAIFADQAWPRILTGRLPLFVVIALAVLSAGMLVQSMAWRRRLHKLVLLLLLASVLLQVGTCWTRPSLEIWMLDVGQGDAMIIRSSDGTVTLVDAGTESAGNDVVQPALQALGIRRITQVIATHGHADHAGGLLPLMTAGQVQRLILPQAGIELDSAAAGTAAAGNGMEQDVLATVLGLAVNSRIPVQGVQKGDTIPVGSGAQLTILAPETAASAAIAAIAARRRGANAGNLVMKLTDGSGSFIMLLTGDCDLEEEQALLQSGQSLTATILRVAHHGSAATTGNQLLAAVQPQLALISVGRNDYGHPAPVTLDRLTDRAVPVIRTDRQGAVTIRINRGRASVATHL